METATYATLTRQQGLLREMEVIANNIANANTTGFRQEGIIFSEYIAPSDNGQSVSMAAARIGRTDFSQGNLEQTGSVFDLAIEGEGFFLIQTPDGTRLSRAGAFSPSAEGIMVTSDGNPVLDIGEAPVFLPPGAENITISRDGTISSDGQLLGQIGVARPLDPTTMTREGSMLFDAPDGFEPVDNPNVVQGFVEGSNVDPILQIARMVEVQRAYELGQSFMEREDERIRAAVNAMME